MYRLLIVDDEPFIVDSLEKLLSSNISYELDIIKTYFPTKAIEITKSVNIDIIITDIRMQRMTGIKMMEEIYLFSPGVKVIFLTGFSDFESIYKITNEFGAKYILKNEDDEIIISLVDGLIKDIKKEIEVKEALENHKSIIENDINSNLLENQIKSDENKLIESIKNYIENNLSEDLSLVTLANRVYMNPSYFSRLFKKATNKNLSSYIQDLKIEYAKDMLEDSRHKISDIAESVGFDSPAYFATYFKRITKETPQSYRERYIIKSLNKII